MRRLSVTEYLIAQNQAQTTVTTFRNMGAALDTLITAHGKSDACPTVSYDYGAAPRSAPSEEHMHIVAHKVHGTSDGDVSGYVHAWRAPDGTITYTAEKE